MKMNKKEKFLRAVQILAPGNNLIMQVAQRVSEEQLPFSPGGMALELVAKMERLLTTAACPRSGRHSTPRRRPVDACAKWNLSLAE
jgi:hypothetical protein